MEGLKFISLLQIVFCFIILLDFSSCAENPIVEIQQGKLQGTVLTSSRSNNDYFAFTGIPYAKPPLGNLRFKAPQPADPWTGIWDATEERDICFQNNLLKSEYEGSEDCLFINVYTPQLPSLTENLTPMPVMVYIHCGRFQFGSGNRELQGPDHLVDEGILYVTFNHRLGPFGFLSLENKEVPGNAGMKDQVMAFKWVQQNIAEFGGDPNSVTIFGHNSGAASVHYHMLSPMSDGLFHKAISQSGSALCPWAYTHSARDVAYRLGSLLGKTTTDDVDLLEFLQQVPSEKIMEMSTANLMPEEERDPLRFMVPFVPTKEKFYEDGEEVFLPDEPKQLILQGKIAQVPYITGVCSHDGYLVYLVSQKNDINLDHINNDLSELVLPTIHARNDIEKINEIGAKIKNFYFGDSNISNETIQNFVKYTSDIYFKYPTYNSIKLQSTVSTSPVYYYQFNFDGRYGFRKDLVGLKDMPGAFHGEELGYMFSVESLKNMHLDETEPEVQVLRNVVKIWTDFAKTGNPTPDSQLNIQWFPYSTDQHNYLIIDKELTVGTDLDKDRMDFCDQLYTSED